MQTKSRSSLAVAVICFLLIYLPIIGMILPVIDTTPRMLENRRLAVVPSFNGDPFSNYASKFENYFNDHFGFRNFLIRLQIKFNDKVLNIEHKGIKVLKGEDGWLFYTGNHTVDQYRGLNPFTLDQLEQWQKTLEIKGAFLKSQGIEYLFVVAPNKSSIYPEYLPDWVEKSAKATPLDQLVAYLEENSEVEILDLRHVIREEKAQGHLLYHKSDTHWNQKGAFVAYREIMRNIGQLLPQTTALSLDDVTVAYRGKKGGDLPSMLGTQEDVTEQVPIIVPLIKHAKKTYSTDGPPNEILMESQLVDRPRVIMFRDSFAGALIPYISEHFSNSRYIWSKWEQETPIQQLISENKPDIVIEERLERFITQMPNISFDLN